MAVSALVSSDSESVTTATYRLPKELAQHIWRLACKETAREGSEGASESGMMEAAWRLFLELSIDENFALIARTFRRQNRLTDYKRKTYSFPPKLITDIAARMFDLKLAAESKKIEKPILWLAAEAAQIHFIELTDAQRSEALARFGIRKKRR